jgi:hypothetical protein
VREQGKLSRPQRLGESDPRFLWMFLDGMFNTDDRFPRGRETPEAQICQPDDTKSALPRCEIDEPQAPKPFHEPYWPPAWSCEASTEFAGVQVRFVLEDLPDLVLRVSESEVLAEALVQAGAQDSVEQAGGGDDLTPGRGSRIEILNGFRSHLGPIDSAPC